MSPKPSANPASKRQEPLKQGTLSFATVKRVASSNSTSKSKSVKPTKSASATKTNNSVDSTEDDFDDIELHSSDDEDEDEIQDSPTALADDKKPTSFGTRAQTRVADKHTTIKKKPFEEQKPAASVTVKPGTIRLKASNTLVDDVPKTIAGNTTDEKPELDVMSRKWSKHYAEVKAKMGHLPAIHDQNKIHEILRVFDLSYEYGPCVGISRLERWERAQAFGLNPPKEVYEILNTKQGSTLDEYSQSVFHGGV